MVSLYHNEGNGLFVDEAPQSSGPRHGLRLDSAASFRLRQRRLAGYFVADGHLKIRVFEARELCRAFASVP
jgi:hypothetical protein